MKFVFADEQGVKQRPGLHVSSAGYHRSRREAILAAITSRGGRSLVGDHRLTKWKEAGLPLPSTATGIIRTITQHMIIRKLGALPAEELANVESQLRVSLASTARDAKLAKDARFRSSPPAPRGRPIRHAVKLKDNRPPNVLHARLEGWSL